VPSQSRVEAKVLEHVLVRVGDGEADHRVVEDGDAGRARLHRAAEELEVLRARMPRRESGRRGRAGRAEDGDDASDVGRARIRDLQPRRDR